jgi:ribosomal protein L11 methyltransferase
MVWDYHDLLFFLKTVIMNLSYAIARLNIMGYYEFRISAPCESKEAVISRLSEIGCLGVTEIDDGLLAYFPDSLNTDLISADIALFKTMLEASGLNGNISFSFIHLPDQDWNETWKKNIQPIDAGERITVIPPWDKPMEGRLNLIIDPGMAFGTGHHETTKTCLGLIERLSCRVTKKRFLDVGSGTGILSVCAAVMGFEESAAVDTDPLAVEAATKNALLNNLDKITVMQGDISASTGVYDMIAANLISETLIMIAPDIASRLKPGGIALLSGMLVGQEDEVISAMNRQGLALDETLVDGGRWVTLVFTF